MAERLEEALSWSNFWQSEAATAFAADEAQQRALRSFWASTSRAWNSGDRVLDLGCGNGALADSLAAIAKDSGRMFRYTGLDQAEIKLPPLLDFKPLEVVLLDNTAAESARLPEAGFDRVISQYGFEYCNREAVSERISAWLAPEGSASFLVHSRDSHLSKEVRYTLEQFRMAEESALLVLVGRLLARLDQLGDGGSADPQARTMRELINSTCRELTDKAKDMPNPYFLRNFVNVCLGSFAAARAHMPHAVRLENIAEFSKQLLFQKARLEQQQLAALSEGQIDESVARLNRLGLRCLRREAFAFDDQRFGIALEFRKR